MVKMVNSVTRFLLKFKMFLNEARIKTFPDKQKLRDFFASRPALQKR